MPPVEEELKVTQPDTEVDNQEDPAEDTLPSARLLETTSDPFKCEGVVSFKESKRALS